MIGLAEERDSFPDIASETHMAFSTEGALSKSPQFEYRPQQQAMATEVARSLMAETSLVTEAGTGVGKSLAYLIPSIKYALASGKKCLLSTHTINLQEQLLEKDVPLAARLIGQPISFTLLKGRQNYLCPSRLKRALQGRGDLFTSTEAAELKRIYDWSLETEDGTASDLDFKPSYKVWMQVCSEGDLCTQRRCGPTGKCFYQEARKRANESQVVILNHNLFFSLLDLEVDDEKEGFLFPKDFIIFDEAHTLENVAAKQLGLRVSGGGIKQELNKLYSSRTKKGILRSAQRLDLAPAVEQVSDLTGEFFDNISAAIYPNGEHLQEGGKRPAKEVRVYDADLVPNTVGVAIQKLRLQLSELAEESNDEMLQGELGDVVRRLGEAQNSIAEFLNLENEEAVYWTEAGRNEYSSLTLRSAPVNIANQLRGVLFGGRRSAIMTSATLSVSKGDISYFKQRVGAERAHELVVGSPFDLARQMETYVASGICEPNMPSYNEEMTTWLTSFLQYCQGRAFVLFTSYSSMMAVSEQVQRLCVMNGWDFFLQGAGSSRQQMIEGFRKSSNAVLMGTDSFWTGVDVPGEALSNVIITRLPFEVPSHPVVQARLDDIKSTGGNSFMDYSLPEAVLKFRQGVGRLIRSGKDTGKVLILDSRVVTKRYGETFLNCLEPSPVKQLKNVRELV